MTANLGNDLRMWAGVARSQGEAPSANLLMRAADTLDAGQPDAELSWSLAVFAAIAADQKQTDFAQCLATASQRLAVQVPAERAVA